MQTIKWYAHNEYIRIKRHTIIWNDLPTRYKEHIRNIRFNWEESAFAQHILGNGHQCGPVEQIMEMIEYTRKANIMNIPENVYIYQSKQNELIEEQRNIKQ
jgi:hypothetical protein